MSQVVNQASLEKDFLSAPGDDLVAKLLLQLSRAGAFSKLFGPYKVNPKLERDTDQQRWANYERGDWSIRQLPAINVFESGVEVKQSDNAFLTGSVMMQVFWPPNFRRPDTARVTATFKGILENFFASAYASDMLDELYLVERDSKVHGLNELGKELNWTTNVFGDVEKELVPVTMVDVRYKIDLRAWYRALEYMGRTKDEPFKALLDDLVRIQGEYDGVANAEADPIEIVVPAGTDVSNP
jgi:hypothetical protein